MNEGKVGDHCTMARTRRILENASELSPQELAL